LEDDGALATGFDNRHHQSNSEPQSDDSSSEGEDVLSRGGQEDGNGSEQSPPQLVKDTEANAENNLSATIRQRRGEDRKKGTAVSKQLVSVVSARWLSFQIQI
jgi:hypothetical protein